MPADYLSRNLVNAISWDSSTLQQAQNADPLLKALKSFLLNKELPHDAKCHHAMCHCTECLGAIKIALCSFLKPSLEF